MISHANISVFVPHLGCKNMCSFCNQIHITGTSDIPSAESVERAVKTALGSPKFNPEKSELAFFGGSFTAIERDYMLELLEAGYRFVKEGAVSGIRISTRPDAIDGEILELLKTYGVSSIELGAQSMDEEVLKANRRGHTAEDVRRSARLIKERGFSLGLQMMTGLYLDSDEKAIKTAREIISLSPETVRIYPTVLLKNTYLEKLYKEGKYLPQTLLSASKLCARLLPMFEKAGISVIRVGLHSIDEAAFVAGPWHPAFGELCEGERYLELMRELLLRKEKGSYSLLVNNREISKAIGQGKRNLKAMEKLGYNCRIKGSEDLEKHKLILDS